jgi:hypothetical protein
MAASKAMIAAIKNRPLTETFDENVAEYDIVIDHWGMGGFGSNE